MKDDDEIERMEGNKMRNEIKNMKKKGIRIGGEDSENEIIKIVGKMDNKEKLKGKKGKIRNRLGFGGIERVRGRLKYWGFIKIGDKLLMSLRIFGMRMRKGWSLRKGLRRRRGKV